MDVQKLEERDDAQEKRILNLDGIMLKIEQVYHEMQSNMTQMSQGLSEKMISWESMAWSKLEEM